VKPVSILVFLEPLLRRESRSESVSVVSIVSILVFLEPLLRPNQVSRQKQIDPVSILVFLEPLLRLWELGDQLLFQ